jgi:pyruvate kinase
MAVILNNATIGDRKNMNLPGCIIDLPVLTEKDVDDLKNFALVHDVDFIAASFVRKAADIDTIRSVLGDTGKFIKIIAKIENQEGMQNYDDILSKTDAIMVARGDLGMEIPIEKVFLAQKMMIAKANLHGKPVVTATQMLESMISNPRPTRAECADIANAVLDGTDCVMLSGETANGEYPLDAVRVMCSTCVEAESIIDYDGIYNEVRARTLEKWGCIVPEESVASSAVKTSRDVSAKIIICLTQTGNTARQIAKYRPNIPIFLLTATEIVARQSQGYLKGCHCEVAPPQLTTAEDLVKFGIERCKQTGYVKSGEYVVCIHGSANASFISGSTRLVQIVTA